MDFEAIIDKECPTPIQWQTHRRYVVGRVKSEVESRDARIRELEEAVDALTKCVIGGMIAKSGLRRCTKTSIGSGGQTIQECVDRERYHNVPLAIFDQFEEAVAATYDNPIAREAVEKARNEAGLGRGA